MPLFAITDVLAAVTQGQPEPPREVLIVTGVLALATVLSPRVWPVARNVITIAHEGGHAAVALAAGRRLSGIRLHSDTSGVTVSRGRASGPGMVATLAAGYPAPSLLGGAYAVLLAVDRITASLWIGVALLLAMLVMIRNIFGVISILATGAVALGVSVLAPASVQAAFAYLLVWFLLFGGVRPVLELQRSRRHRRTPHSDADQLARLTRVPGLLWVLLFAVVSVGAAAAGTFVLLR